MSATPIPAAAVASHPGALAGFKIMLRHILLRDRIRVPLWILAIAMSVVLTTIAFPGLYPSALERQARAELMKNPATIALVGPGHGLDDYTFGAMLANERLAFTGIIVALMSISLTVRHTRADEEAGRTELLRANVLGRHASLAAALTVVTGANLAIAIVTAAGLGLTGVESVDWPGSILFGAALASIGIAFGGIAAVTAQLSGYGRGAFGLGGAVLGVTYALRAMGDLGNGAISWLSPFGWAQATEVFVTNRWWPLLIPVATTAGLAAAAMAMSTRRDVGAGILPQRAGPPTASPILVRPLGFAFRLQRTGLMGWMLGLPLFGLVFGTLAGDAETFLEDAPAIGDVFEMSGASITDSFLAMFVSIVALTSAIFAVGATLRIRAEEVAGRADPILGTSMSRWRWASTHLIVALAGSAAIVLLASLGLGISAAVVLDDATMIPRLLGAGLAYVPAVWCSAGLAIALVGLLPRATGLAWLGLLHAFVVLLFAGLFEVPGWVTGISPFGHVPALPAADVSVLPLALLTLIALGLAIVGLAGFQRRDIATA
jgi:ABC-2 type transport system permease protein